MGKLTFWKWAGITAGLVSALLFVAQITGAATLIPVFQGGTGSSTLGGLLKGNGTGAIQSAIPGTDYVQNLTGNWTGTFDGQEGTHYLNATNLINFGTPFYGFFSATNTDALSEGLSNLYYTAARDIRFSTSSADHWLTTKSTTNLTEGSNLYYTDARVNTLLNASSTIPNRLCATNEILKWNGSIWTCATDQTGSAGSGSNWLFTANQDSITPSTTNKGVIINASSSISALSMVRSTTSQATTTNLNVSNIASTSVLTVSNTLNLPAGSVTNAYLQNSSLTVTAGNGLTGGGAISLGGSASVDLGVDATLSVSANSVGLNLANPNIWTAQQTMSGLIATNATTTQATTTRLYVDSGGLVVGYPLKAGHRYTTMVSGL